MRAKSLGQLRNAFQHPAIRIVSVDVFDTLLLRDTTPEPARFLEVAGLQAGALSEALGRPVPAIDLYLLRRDAARTVYATKTPLDGGREATWREIFELVFEALVLPAEDPLLQLCAEIELDYERARLKLNVSLIELLEAARKAGKTVVCLSDMYLPSAQIRCLIDKVAQRDLSLTVYSSADFGSGKASGALFRRLANDYGVEYSQIAHCGDNWHADVHVPRSLGIRAQFLPRPFSWRLARKARSFWFGRALPAL